MDSLTSSLLSEELPIQSPSRPTSTWSFSGGIIPNSFPPRRPPPKRSSTGWASKIPVLAGSAGRNNGYNPFKFYSEIGDSEEELLQDVRLRFADPPPTLKELHADGKKLTEGFDEEDNGLGDNAAVWDEYVEEAKENDAELMKELNGSLDVLLIFVGHIYILAYYLYSLPV
jgi:hypothetical protein